MSTIRIIYQPENGVPRQPKWPAIDQHPDCVRYAVGLYVVDAVGGEPTLAEVEALLFPPAPPAKTTAEKLAAIGISMDDLKKELAKP